MSQLAIPRLGARATILAESPLLKYSTAFPANESPISEGGRWRRLDPSKSNINVSSGHTYGTSSANESTYTDDSYSLCLAVPPRPNMRASGTMFLGSGLSGFMEAELLLRFSDDATLGACGYECFIAWDGAYCSVARWDGITSNGTGPVQYCVLAEFGSVAAPANGDVFSAQILGNTLTVSLRGSTVGSFDVTSPPEFKLYQAETLISTTWDGIVYSAGRCGLGADMGSGGQHGTEANYGFSSFTAEAL